jgi:hypothetical protein
VDITDELLRQFIVEVEAAQKRGYGRITLLVLDHKAYEVEVDYKIRREPTNTRIS